MYDKTVRRRRAILALLVAASIALLTASFTGADGPVQSAQHGFLTLLGPLQTGADKVLKPFRNLVNWIPDSVKARHEVGKLHREVQQLRAQHIADEVQLRRDTEAARLLASDRAFGIDAYRPVSADVVWQNPTLWYATVGIDAGTGDGVRVGDPVIDGDGLVGTITSVYADGAIVRLITDQNSGVSARLARNGLLGIVQPEVGDPNQLSLQYVANADNVQPGDDVVTSGTVSGRLDSLFPPGIPIGQVTSIDHQDPYQTIHVSPYANLRRLDLVQVLTRGTQGARAAQAQLAAGQIAAGGGG